MLKPTASLHQKSEAAEDRLRKELGLTRRQTEVLHWLSLGKRDAEIATILGCSRRTINAHVAACLKKLNCETRTAAANTVREYLEDEHNNGQK